MAKPPMQFYDLSGVEKAAMLLLCLGERATSMVFKELSDAEVRAISRCMVSMEHVPAPLAREVIGAYEKAQVEYAGIFVKGDEFVKNAISESGDPKRIEQLMEQVAAATEKRPLETIALMQPRVVASLLASEHPQTMALILSTQKPDHTSRILSYLPDDVKSDVMYRIAKIEQVSPDVIKHIEDALQREIGVVSDKEQQELGGIDTVVDILARMEKGADRNILTRIDEVDPEMAEAIRKKMFTFDDLVMLDNPSLQKILREVDNDTLTLALKAATPEVKEKIFSNISIRAAEMIEEELEAMGPVRLSEVESMQQTIVKIALRLEEEGTLIIPGRGGDDVLV
ncbi:MAG: flagellar motor switch protein FliG [Desulfuromonadales bacterium]|uniref:flagellar motor switch protein FliG n=1 Tax=Desulfuromonas sp. KJ2020 TaxID=2919173 RepID=UPI0020A6F683|nr:flagellar motor switch protein FliG [Desulfuromonas sp. KJ2020]MCP3178390.1 flagellar motor switch protein FliG [Desulfuromonas sp. KJ2020]